ILNRTRYSGVATHAPASLIEDCRPPGAVAATTLRGAFHLDVGWGVRVAPCKQPGCVLQPPLVAPCNHSGCVLQPPLVAPCNHSPVQCRAAEGSRPPASDTSCWQ